VSLLFDSHAVLWWLADESRIPATVRKAVRDTRTAPMFSLSRIRLVDQRLMG